MSIKLYDLVGKDISQPFSPHCWKIKMSFAHLGLAYETVPTRFTQIPALEGGGYATVPTVRDGEMVLQDSFEIARHYGKQALFGGDQGEPLVRFIEGWCFSQLHSWIGGWAMLDIFHLLDAEDQAYFRSSREKIFGKTLEELTANRADSVGELEKRLLPIKLALRHHKFIGGDTPNFADYIVFGAFQWLRIASGHAMIPADHLVIDWFKRCQDLHDGLGHTVTAGSST